MSEYRLVDRATGELIATIINLWDEKWTNCHRCGKECPDGLGLPVCAATGEYVYPEYAGEWGGVPACESCFRWYEDKVAARRSA